MKSSLTFPSKLSPLFRISPQIEIISTEQTDKIVIKTKHGEGTGRAQ